LLSSVFPFKHPTLLSSSSMPLFKPPAACTRLQVRHVHNSLKLWFLSVLTS
jgi:hypothetical protein